MNYYKHEVMQADDNPPIGLLLCTDYGETTVQYATEGLSQNLFVSKYRLQLPSEDDIKQYLLENISQRLYGFSRQKLAWWRNTKRFVLKKDSSRALTSRRPAC